MQLQKQCLVRPAFLLTCVVSALGVTALWAGPSPFSITRTVDQDASKCTAGPTVVTLQGDGSGNPTDPLTVVENLSGSGDSSNLVLSDISPGGMLVGSSASAVGMFNGRLVLEIPSELSQGTNNNTIHNGADFYTSLSETGRDIWTTGDTCEFAYTRLDGDFDVSVRIDTYDHASLAGCWGKYGLMARRTNEFNSRMVMASNHGPQGTPGAHGCSTPEKQSTSVLGRRCHFGTVPTPQGDPGPIQLFEAVVGEPMSGGFPSVYTNYDYLRLTRRGNLFEGWGTSDSAVESDPTLDANWEKITIHAVDGGDYEVPATEGEDTCQIATAASPCWYVGFANSDHVDDGPNLQTVDFTVLEWIGTSCFVAEPTGNVITWTNVPRSDVNAGLTYTANVAPAASTSVSLRLNGQFGSGTGAAAGLGLEKGLVGDATSIVGPDRIDLVATEQFGALTLQGIGSGTGTVVVDGSVFEMQGIGPDIGSDADNFAFLYQKMTGDFDAVINVIDRDLSQGGAVAKHGPMVRETCDPGSRNDYTNSRSEPRHFTRYAYRRNHLTGGGSTEPYGVPPGLIPGEKDPPFPDFYRMIRTGSQTTGFVAYEDPENNGEPLHWCVVGARNVQGRGGRPVRRHGDQ